MSKLFSEIYGCYFNIVSRILNKATDGISKNEIEEIINNHGFLETAFHLLPQIIDGEWSLLERRGDLYYSKFKTKFTKPLTQLELSWLASIIKDRRIRLFLSDKDIAELTLALKDIPLAFETSDFISVDSHQDGDPYRDPVYIENFRKILKACKNNELISIAYNAKGGRSQRTYIPFKLSYSELNDKFRLLCVTFDKKTQKLIRCTLNLGRIDFVEPSLLDYRVAKEELSYIFSQPNDNPPITLQITKERNSLERFLLQFASFDRKTEYDSERDIYICQIFYDLKDETELLIRILSFGPTVKVLGPQSFLTQLKARLTTQLTFIS